MNNKVLLEDIKRIHQIIGISPSVILESEINEANNPIATEGARIFSKFLSGLEKDLVVGAKQYTKAEVKNIVKKIGTNTLTNDEKLVLQTFTKSMLAADKKLFNKFVNEIYGELLKQTNARLRGAYYASVKKSMKEMFPDTELAKLFSEVDNKVAAATGRVGSGATSGSGSTAGSGTTPGSTPGSGSASGRSGSGRTNTVGLSDVEKQLKQMADSNPQVKSYFLTVDNLNLDTNIAENLKLNAGKYAEYSVPELIQEAKAISDALNDKQFGWLKSLLRQWLKNPAKNTWTIGKTTVAISAAVAVGAIAITFGQAALRANSKLRKSLNLSDDDSNNKNNSDAGIAKPGALN